MSWTTCFAVGDGVGDAVFRSAGKSETIGRCRFSGDHADGDLRGARVEGRAHGLAAVVGDGDERAGRDAVGGDDVGAVDPDVSGFEAGGAAGGDLDLGRSDGAGVGGMRTW